MKKVRFEGQRSFMLPSLLFIFFLCVLAFINEARFDSLLNFGKCALSDFPSNSSNSTNNSTLSNDNSTDLRILIGIPTLPDQYHRRHLLRMVYGTQSSAGAQIDVKFVFCNLTKDDQTILVALEIMRYDDIIILNCQENMDDGKTYTYFSSLPELLLNDTDRPYPPYHYVMKGDDDTYIRLEKLVESVKPLARDDLYYGFLIPCKSMDPYESGGYMSGMGYMVSWDIVEWIRESEIPRNNTKGPEDLVFGEWLRDGHRAKNRHTPKWSMYDFPHPHTGCTHDLWPDTIAVHRLKNQPKWIDTLKFFNATSNLKPSKMYHIY